MNFKKLTKRVRISNKLINVNFQAQKAFVVKTLAKFAIICPKNSRIIDDGVF